MDLEALERTLELSLKLQNGLAKILENLKKRERKNALMQEEVSKIILQIESSSRRTLGSTSTRPLFREKFPHFIDEHKLVPPPNHEAIRIVPLAEKLKALRAPSEWATSEVKNLRREVIRENTKIYHNFGQSPTLLIPRAELEFRRTKLDWEVIAKHCGSVRTAMGYKLRWINLLHPEIERGPLTPEEFETVQTMVEITNDWRAIAEALGPTRRAWQVFAVYATRIAAFMKVRKEWDSEEDRLLQDAIAKYGTKSWKLVAACVPLRTPTQCHTRHTILSGNKGVKRGRWRTEEDEALLAAVKVHGRGKWLKIAELVPSRNDSQCRERYENVLCPDLKKSPLEPHEVEQLARLVAKHGERQWAKVAKEFEGRTDNFLKRAWVQMKKKGQLPSVPPTDQTGDNNTAASASTSISSSSLTPPTSSQSTSATSSATHSPRISQVRRGAEQSSPLGNGEGQTDRSTHQGPRTKPSVPGIPLIITARNQVTGKRNC
ncbi:hypothetical protein BJ742DRAFT_798444 [Cladochytrium replicatum]|nr:hypothetical protein BJ742DRAFT_798444 [Cladochytrium replicatum]